MLADLIEPFGMFGIVIIFHHLVSAAAGFIWRQCSPISRDWVAANESVSLCYWLISIGTNYSATFSHAGPMMLLCQEYAINASVFAGLAVRIWLSLQMQRNKFVQMTSMQAWQHTVYCVFVCLGPPGLWFFVLLHWYYKYLLVLLG